MRDKISKNHLLTRFILLFNIIFITITVIFFILFNNTLAGLNIPPYFQNILMKMNILIFGFSFIIVLFNAYLLVNHLFYNTKQYFKLAEKLDFNDLSSSLGILNSLPAIDEYGDLGKRVTKLLRVYLNYANLMRKRLAYQDKKMKVLIEEAKIPILIFDRQIDHKTYQLSFVSKTARPFLQLDNSSTIIGKSANTLYSKETQAKIQGMLIQNPRENMPIQMSYSTTLEWIKPTDKDILKEESIVLEASIIPFNFYFSDDYQYQDPKSNLSNFNTVIDYYFVLLHQAKTSQKDDEGLDPNLEQQLHSILDLNIDTH